MSSESVRPHLLTYAEVAAWLGRSVTFVEKAVRFRGLPVVRQGRNVRFDRQEVRHWMDEQDEEWDNRITPVRPTPRGGHREVYPRDTIGDLDSCWCGDSLDHDWPGKQTGAPHPHDHEGMQQVVLVQNEEEPQEGRIDRKMLRGFHGTLKSFIVKCVNENGLRYRYSTKNSELILYPPDDSRPISVYARNNDSQMRSLRQWYAAHVEPFIKVGEASVQDLAVKFNDPAEHPPAQPDPPEGGNQVPGSSEEWVTYTTEEGVEVPEFETNGSIYRCRLCMGTEQEYVSDRRTGIGGHVRMMHRERANLYTPEAQAKALDTRRFNRLNSEVAKAVEILAVATGTVLGSSRELEQLRAEVAKQKKRADDAEAKLALMREAFQGLE